MSYRKAQTQRPQTSSYQARDFQQQPELYTKPDMLKVLETYKRSVDYFNSFGLEQGPNSTRGARTESRANTEQSNTFWDYR